MKFFKRTLVVLLALFTFMTLPTFTASDEVTSVLGAKYKVTSTEEENELSYGVKHYRHFAESSTKSSGVNAAGLGGGGTLVANKLYPQQVNYLEVPSSQYLRVVTWSTTTETNWRLNTVRAFAQDYERNHPGWKVIAAINGDFFDINGDKNLPYQTSGASVHNGDVYKSVTGATVGFTNNGTGNTLIGNEKVERTPYMVLGIYDENNEIVKTFNVNNINLEPENNGASLYYANWNEDKKIDPIQVPEVGEVFVVEEAEKALANATNDFYGRGVITSTEAKELVAGEFAIVSKDPEINAALEVGTKIRIQYEYVGAYAGVQEITGAGATLLKNGVANDGTVERAPRTMIGRRPDGTIIMAVIDGRQPNENMYGANQEEMAALMHHYGCVDAYNLDGGGSSTLLIREGSTFRVTNTPSDGRERTDANAILIVAYDPEFDIVADAQLNAIKVSASLVSANGFEVDKVFLEIDNVQKEITEQGVSFTNLQPNTQYIYNIYIQLETGEKLKLVTQGTVTTSKRTPVLRGITYEIDGNELIVSVDFFDEHQAITRARVFLDDLDGKAAYVNSGIAIIRNPGEEPAEGFNFVVTYRVDKNDGKPFYEIFLRNVNNIISNYIDTVAAKHLERTNTIFK